MRCKVIEKTYCGKIYEWDGTVIKETEAFIETEHSRKYRPEFVNFNRAYEKTRTKHYANESGHFINLIIK